LRTAILAAFFPIPLTAVLGIAFAEPGMVDSSGFGLLGNPSYIHRPQLLGKQ
jgi:hypothetical protein